MKNIYVCVKHVPDSAANITIIENRRIENNIAFLLNPYDEHALTEAGKIKTLFQDARVIAVCLGRADAQKTVRSAMAMGADTGILIETDTILDSMTTARALKTAMDQFGLPDIIFTGRESIDSEGMQTMFRIGALYGFPVATNVVRLDIKNEKAVVDTEFSGGICHTYELSLPCVLGTGRGLNTPKYPTFKDVFTSKKKPINRMTFADMAGPQSSSSVEMTDLQPLNQLRKPKQMSGGTRAVAQQIITILKDEANVL